MRCELGGVMVGVVMGVWCELGGVMVGVVMG